MNYEPNTRHWEPDELVIHDADAKTPDMLMRVIGYTPNGMVETEYADPVRRAEWKRRFKRERDRKLLNAIGYLHDPARFGIQVTTCPTNSTAANTPAAKP